MTRRTGAICLFLIPIVTVLTYVVINMVYSADASYAFELSLPLGWSAALLWPLAAFFWWKRNAPVGAAPTRSVHWKRVGIAAACVIILALLLRVLDQVFGLF